jgi:hypothetical protein
LSMKTFTGSLRLWVKARAKSEPHFNELCAGVVAKTKPAIQVVRWELDEVVAIPKVPKGKLLLHLCTEGNPDHGQFASVTEPEWHVVDSLVEAREKCGGYLERHEGFIGAGNWGPQSGEVLDHRETVVARFAFNLRCCSPSGADLPCTNEAPAVASRKPMKFTVLGPDGIPIREKPFCSREAAERGIMDFVNRFRLQGYYAGVVYRLKLEEIAGRCTIRECGAEG